MTEKQTRIFMIFGPALLLFTVGVIYYDFFVPKVGPLGSGKRYWTTYMVYTCNLILGTTITIRAIIGWVRLKK